MQASMTKIEVSDDAARAFHELMRSRRQERWSRQADAAEDIGVSQELISRIESRFTPNFRVGEFLRILEAYSISPNEAFSILGLYRPTEQKTVGEAEELLRPLDAQEREEALNVLRTIVLGIIQGRRR